MIYHCTNNDSADGKTSSRSPNAAVLLLSKYSRFGCWAWVWERTSGRYQRASFMALIDFLSMGSMCISYGLAIRPAYTIGSESHLETI